LVSPKTAFVLTYKNLNFIV